MSDLIKTYLPNVYRFGSTDDDGLTQVHYIVCTDSEQATGFANALFDGSPKQGSVTAPELVADYCFIHDVYVNELATVDRYRIAELEAEAKETEEQIRKDIRDNTKKLVDTWTVFVAENRSNVVEIMFLKEAFRKATRERWIWFFSGLMAGFIGCGILLNN